MAMITHEIIVLDPTVGPLPVQATMAPRPSTLNGLTVGLLANGKRNADRLLDHVAGLLTERYQLNEVVTWDKRNSSRPCPDELMREIVERCDVVVTATGDWGSCSSCSVHDGITLENSGRPTAVICTAPFTATGKMMARIQGNPGYPFAVIPHPITALTEEQLAERARQALPQVLRLLLGRG